MSGKLAPTAIEHSIASTVMFDVRRVADVMGKLMPNHFFDDNCRKIYEEAITAYASKQPFNELVAVAKSGLPEAVVLDITANNPPLSRDAMVSAAEVVIESFGRREAIKRLDEVKQKLMNGEDVTADELKVPDISTKTPIESNMEIVERMEKMIQNPIIDHGTGIAELDNMVNIAPGSLIVVAARPSMGKTGFIATVQWHLLKKREGSLFFSLEMPSEAIMTRLIANEAEIPVSEIKRGEISDFDAYKRARDKIANASNYFIVDSSVTETDIFNLSMAIKREHPSVKNIFVDHLTYIKKSSTADKNMHLWVSGVTKTLKRLAKELDVKVWLLSQLSRSIESRPNKRPQLSDLRESGAIEEDADVVIGLYRPSYYKSRETGEKEPPVNDAELIVLKNRDGMTGTAHTHFVSPSVKFTDRPASSYPVDVVTYTEDTLDDVMIDMPVV